RNDLEIALYAGSGRECWGFENYWESSIQQHPYGDDGFMTLPFKTYAFEIFSNNLFSGTGRLHLVMCYSPNSETVFPRVIDELWVLPEDRVALRALKNGCDRVEVYPLPFSTKKKE